MADARNILRGDPPGARNILRDEGKEMSWSEVGVQALQNVPDSGKKFFLDMWNAVSSPVETGKSLYDVAAGAVKLIDGDDGGVDEQKAKAVGDFFAKRYGTVNGFKNAVATDPVGIMADVATLLTGGGFAAARAPGMAGKLAQLAGKTGAVAAGTGRVGTAVATAGRAVNKAGHMLDPTLLPFKAAKAASKIPVVGKFPGDAARTVMGGLTGTGTEAWRHAAGSGVKGGEAGRRFRDMMRGGDMADPVGSARRALNNLKAQKNQAYRTGMETVKEATAPINFGPIDDALRDVLDRGVFKGRSGQAAGYTVNPSTEVIAKKLQDIVDDYRFKDPSEFHTPIGMDALKQRVGDLYNTSEAAYGQTGRGMVDGVYHAIREQIIKHAPSYKDTMVKYDAAREAIENVEHSLGIGQKSKLDTAARKLSSAMRNNVNTSFGVRQKAAEMLAEAGAPHLLEELAGATLASGKARGIPSALAPGVGLSVGANAMETAMQAGEGLTVPWEAIPAAAAAYTVTSPRLMGELVHGGGRAVGMASRALDTPVGAAVAGPGARLGAYQGGRLEEELRRRGIGISGAPY